MTRDEWDVEYDKKRLHLMYDRGLSAREAWQRARILTERQYGPRPGDPKLPAKMRVGLWWMRRKLKGVEPLEVSMFAKKVIVSLLYGLGAAAPVAQLALADGVISGNEWGGLISAAFVAFWGKFSSNTTVLKPSRKGETMAGPKE